MKVNNIKELNDLIYEMEKRLGLFIGNNDLGRLFCFIDGFLYSKDINNVPFTVKEKKYIKNFYKWIKKYYKYYPDTSVGTEEIIIFYVKSNNHEATKEFFKLYKQWHKEEFGEDAW